jgi:hypothetical protein
MAFIGTPLDTRNTFQSLQGKRFNGDGSTTDFTLDVSPGNVLDIEVFVGNVRQDPNSAYTVSGTTLAFTGAPPSGTNNIYVVHQAKSVGTIDVPAGGVAADGLATSVLTGQTDIGGAIADADLFLLDDGAGGTLRKTAASRIKTYIGDNTPSFSAKLSSNQSISASSYTKLAFASEEWDVGGTYDASTNYRFTPAIVGKYNIKILIMWENEVSQDKKLQLAIYKNGSFYADVENIGSSQSGADPTLMINLDLSLDADDYVEAYAYQSTSGAVNVVANYSWFQGNKLIGA